jgi:hypothetical protein
MTAATRFLQNEWLTLAIYFGSIAQMSRLFLPHANFKTTSLAMTLIGGGHLFLRDQVQDNCAQTWIHLTRPIAQYAASSLLSKQLPCFTDMVALDWLANSVYMLSMTLFVSVTTQTGIQSLFKLISGGYPPTPDTNSPAPPPLLSLKNAAQVGMATLSSYLGARFLFTLPSPAASASLTALIALVNTMGTILIRAYGDAVGHETNPERKRVIISLLGYAALCIVAIAPLAIYRLGSQFFKPLPTYFEVLAVVSLSLKVTSAVRAGIDSIYAYTTKKC